METIYRQRLFYQRLPSMPIKYERGKNGTFRSRPKSSKPWWVWLLIALLAMLLAGMLINKCSADGNSPDGDSVSNDTS